MINIAICDDEILFTSELESILKKISQKHGFDAKIDVYFDGETLVRAMDTKHLRYDLIFLDIAMSGMNGLETARFIRAIDELVYIIYVTNYDSYAIEAYEVHPFQFVVKPVNMSIIEKYFVLAYEKILRTSCYYQYKYNNDYYRILLKDIIYFESDKRQIHIHISDGTIKTYYDKLNDIEEYLQKAKVDFWRIHQSILVNSIYIRKKSYDYIELTDGEIFFISEKRRKNINDKYIKMIEGEIV